MIGLFFLQDRKKDKKISLFIFLRFRFCSATLLFLPFLQLWCECGPCFWHVTLLGIWRKSWAVLCITYCHSVRHSPAQMSVQKTWSCLSAVPSSTLSCCKDKAVNTWVLEEHVLGEKFTRKDVIFLPQDYFEFFLLCVYEARNHPSCHVFFIKHIFLIFVNFFSLKGIRMIFLL